MNKYGKTANLFSTTLLATVGLIVSTSASLIDAAPAKAQGFAVSLGIGLGTSLLSRAANHHRNRTVSSTNYSSDASNQYYQSFQSSQSSQPSEYYSSTPYSSSYSSSSFSRRSAAKTAEDNSYEVVARKNMAIDLYNAGVGLFNDKNYQAAQSMFERSVAIDASRGDAHALLAACRSKTGQLAAAMPEYELADKYGAHYDWLSYEEGLCAFGLKDYENAGRNFKASLQVAKSDAETNSAKRALEIVQHDFIAPTGDDYLSAASRHGVRRWADSNHPLKVYVQVPNGLEGYSPELESILKKAFSDWSTGTGGKIKFAFVQKAEDAQITCSWTANQADLGGTEELGITRLVYVEDEIKSAEIKLLTVKPSKEDSMTQLLSQAKSTDLHEIGHALGLQHSDCSFDTMYPQVAPAGLEFPLTGRDCNTVMALYNQNANHATTTLSCGISSSAARK